MRRESDTDEAREGTMNEHENDIGKQEDPAKLPVEKASGGRRTRDSRDLVVDFSGVDRLTVANLSLLLTAQQTAEKEDREVWLAGVPVEVWQALQAMGLGRFFKPLPVFGAAVS